MNASQSLDWWRPEGVAVAPADADATVDAEGRAGTVAFRGLLAFTFVLVIAPQEIIPALGALRPALLAALIAIAAHLRDRGAAARSAGYSRELVIAGILLGWSVVTIPLSMWPGGSVTLLSDLFIKALIAFWLVSVVVDRVERLRSLFWALAVMSVPLAVTGLRHYAAGEFTPDAITRIQGYRSALAGNPNDLALMLDIIMPLTAALLLTARGFTAKAVLLGI